MESVFEEQIKVGGPVGILYLFVVVFSIIMYICTEHVFN